MYCHCLSQKIQFQIYCCVSQQFFYYAHKFILLEILPLILEVIYTAVSLLPLMQYDVICDVLLQTLVGWPFFILKDHFFKHHPHFDVCEMNATVLVTDRPMFKPQQPHRLFLGDNLTKQKNRWLMWGLVPECKYGATNVDYFGKMIWGPGKVGAEVGHIKTGICGRGCHGRNAPSGIKRLIWKCHKDNHR
jgi:hypothetical protein